MVHTGPTPERSEGVDSLAQPPGRLPWSRAARSFRPARCEGGAGGQAAVKARFRHEIR
jgi:hypothetical protein